MMNNNSKVKVNMSEKQTQDNPEIYDDGKGLQKALGFDYEQEWVFSLDKEGDDDVATIYHSMSLDNINLDLNISGEVNALYENDEWLELMDYYDGTELYFEMNFYIKLGDKSRCVFTSTGSIYYNGKEEMLVFKNIKKRFT